MSTVAQRCVPIHARKLAKAGDARALLAIEQARVDIPRLIAGSSRGRYSPGEPATTYGSRKAIAVAKALVAEREQRRADRAIAEKARTAIPGQRAQQLADKRRHRIEAALDTLLDRHYRCATSSWAGGETTNRVTLSDNHRAESSTYREWSKNGKWSGQSLTRYVNVSPRWLTDVRDNRLAAVDGLVTTHAKRLDDSTAEIELHAATWICQGRGMEIRWESGVIARHLASGMTYHSVGSDSKRALAGIRRKLTAQGLPPEIRDARRQASAVARAAKQAVGIARLIDRLSKWDFAEIQHVVVSRSDSLKAGNCESGTDAFIHRFFPDRDLDRATVGEIAGRIGTLDIRALAGADLALARQLAAAVLVAVRKDKQARRALSI